MNIILIGFRGTGKTTIGRILAQRLGKGFIDADEFLEQKEGKTIKDIFAEGGEKLFRKIETKIIAKLCILDDKVIATGGGVILNEENVRMLKKNGIMILLDADANTIHKRIRDDSNIQQKRPSLTNHDAYQEIEYLLEYRKPFYDKVADFVLNTSHISTQDATDKILAFIRSHVMDLKK